MSPRLSVLICAAACHPDFGSEPGVGWNWVKHLSKTCCITVISSDYRGSRAAIERELRKDPSLSEAVQFHFLPWFLPTGSHWQSVLLRYYQPLYYCMYERWMRVALESAMRLTRTRRFDLTHQLTMIGFREPGYMWKIPLPFVWGPVGGTQDVPYGFLPSLGAVEALRHGTRNIINWVQFRYQRRFRHALDQTSVLISVASDTRESFLRVYRKDSIVIPASFTQAGHARARLRRVLPGGTVRIVFSALHLSRKGLPFLLRALALQGERRWHLDVLGAGLMTGSWRALARRLGIDERLTWHGQLPRESALALMSEADLFAFPSLQEGSPAVVAEALSLGLPVVTLDRNGMRDFIDESCGVRIRAVCANQLVTDLARVLHDLLCAPERIELLSRGALARAAMFSPDVQIPRVVDAYERAVLRK